MTAKDNEVIENQQNPPAAIIDRIQLEAPQEIDRHNERNRQQIAANEAAARYRADRATAARQKLAESPRGARALARVEAIRTGKPHPVTLELAAQINEAERSAAAIAETFVLNEGKLTEAWHHCLPFSAEMQKLAKDARYTLMTPHMVSPDGQRPNATTVNPENRSLLTSVVVYATSRPGARWVLAEAADFAAVTTELKADVQCDVSSAPYAKKLEPYKRVGKTDCIAEMAEDIARVRFVNDYCEREGIGSRDDGPRPSALSTGLLIPVAFGSDIVMLKLCVGHALALADKYGIQIQECDIVEPWESVGNYW